MKNIVLVLAAVGFLSTASGLTRRLHVADDADHHDSSHCMLCHMILAAAKFHLEPPAPDICVAALSATVVQAEPAFICQHTPAVLAPRPPPLDTV